MFNTDAQRKLSESGEKLAIAINADAQSEPPASAEKLAIEQKYHDLVNQMDMHIKSTFSNGVHTISFYSCDSSYQGGFRAK